MPRLRDDKKAAVATSLRLSATAKELWEKTAAELGLSLSDTAEMAIRKLAKSEGITVDQHEETPMEP